MILKFGARCRCRSEIVGTLRGVLVEPRERLVLALVVEQPQAEPLVRIRVPFLRVDAADPDQIALGLSAADFRELPEHDGSASRTPRRPPGRGARGAGPSAGDERLLTARTRIECRDGADAGTLGCLIVDPRSGDISGFAFPFGVTVMRDLQVGADQIAEVQGDRIVLEFDEEAMQELPTLRA